ncbi:GWT1-domain-containing protein [Vararia minispora EC-137]|uniref:GWT1-domain-containing protein n=1 Tax=Vararia minispora EC-137 TaxID=1314806 RepID=A0ACB8QIY9_9AGAM|nr:GWT1-domain-containing protein [Vararia minispora EC-137]
MSFGAASYKTAKEAFVADGTGSSVAHVNLLSLSAVLSVALHVVLLKRLPPPFTRGLPLFFLSLLTLILPLLLAITLFAPSPARYSAALAVLTAAAFLLPVRESGTPLPSSAADAQDRRAHAVAPLPALTTYRAHMLLMTALCILAVDFKVFPRMLAKCETYGASLMDIGVGSFVFSQGIAAAHPLIRDPAHLAAPLPPKLARAARKAAPILALGLVRVLLVKGTEYPEHVTEYGVHWNFFLTLALLPVLQILLHPLLAQHILSIPALGFTLCAAHQLLLSAGLATYILTAPRTASLLSANREGILSLPGYLALHVLGLAAGTAVLPPSPSAFRRMLARRSGARRKKDDDYDSSDGDEGAEGKDVKVKGRDGAGEALYRENDKTATVLFAWSLIYWSALGACMFLGIGTGISRRMVNAQYILWTAAYNTTFLLLYLALDLLLCPSPLSTSVYDPVSHLKVRARANTHDGRAAPAAPRLLDAVNRNGLAFFLLVRRPFVLPAYSPSSRVPPPAPFSSPRPRHILTPHTQANLATGAVNLSMQTLYASDATALAVLALYASALCAFAWALADRRLL